MLARLGCRALSDTTIRSFDAKLGRQRIAKSVRLVDRIAAVAAAIHSFRAIFRAPQYTPPAMSALARLRSEKRSFVGHVWRQHRQMAVREYGTKDLQRRGGPHGAPYATILPP